MHRAVAEQRHHPPGRVCELQAEFTASMIASSVKAGPVTSA
jgi:hypothetical protein